MRNISSIVYLEIDVIICEKRIGNWIQNIKYVNFLIPSIPPKLAHNFNYTTEIVSSSYLLQV